MEVDWTHAQKRKQSREGIHRLGPARARDMLGGRGTHRG